MRAADVRLVFQETLERTDAKPHGERQRTQFTAGELKDLVKRFELEQIRIRTYHPKSNGTLERYHRTTREALAEEDLRNLCEGARAHRPLGGALKGKAAACGTRLPAASGGTTVASPRSASRSGESSWRRDDVIGIGKIRNGAVLSTCSRQWDQSAKGVTFIQDRASCLESAEAVRRKMRDSAPGSRADLLRKLRLERGARAKRIDPWVSTCPSPPDLSCFRTDTRSQEAVRRALYYFSFVPTSSAGHLRVRVSEG